MKFKTDLLPLQTALGYIQKAIPSNPQLPILSSIKFEIRKSSLTMAATDLYLGIKTTVPVSTKKEVSLVFPGETFREMISSFSADEVEFEIKGSQLVAEIEQSKVRIPTQGVEEFPDFPSVGGRKFGLSGEILEEIKTLVAFAAGTDQARPILTAVMFRFGLSGLEVVGTDGFRLAIMKYPDITTEKESQFLIPAKAFYEVCRIASQADAKEVVIQVSGELKQVKFQVNRCEIYIRLIDGDYPPYEKIIPDSYEFQVEIDGLELKDELQRAFVLAKEASNIIKLNFSGSDLTVKSSSSTHGEYEGEIPAAGLGKSANMEIAFNVSYLLDFLNSAKPELVELSMNESLKPVGFKIKGLENFSYIVMPFRAND